jgi:hypothetical protein
VGRRGSTPVLDRRLTSHRRPLRQGLAYLVNDLINIRPDRGVGKPENPEAIPGQDGVADAIVLGLEGFAVVRAVEFDDQHSIVTYEVEEISAPRPLAPEVITFGMQALQTAPQPDLRLGHVVAKLSASRG